MFNIVILECNNCNTTFEYEGVSPKVAENRFKKHGGEIKGHSHLCGVCVNRRDSDYFAIDIGRRNPQILAVLYDPTALYNVRLQLPDDYLSDDTLSEKKEKRLVLRRITKGEYGTLGAFGIPVVQIETIALSYKYDERRISDDGESNEILSTFIDRTTKILDLRNPIRMLQKGKLPEKAA